MELVFYNSMLSGVSLDGRRFFYANPLTRRADSQPTLHNESLERWADNTVKGASRSWCCPPNVSRTLAGMHEYAYGLSEGTVWVNLYGSNTLRAGAIRLKQETEYPWEGTVRLTMESAGEYALRLRIPAWAEGARIQVNHQPSPTPAAGSYAELRRAWKAGDAVELTLPMEPRRVLADPAVEAANNHVAIMRGPLVYCLESPDLPAGVRFDQVALPDAARLTPRREPALLGGVTVLEGEAVVRPQPDFAGALYRALTPGAATRARIRLIPYYAWANRGISYMTVWIPRA
jgi:DUF1680 family protein